MPTAIRWFLQLGALNPITIRLVQNGSKRIRHMYVRSAYLAVLIIVLLWMLLFQTGGGALDYRQLAEAGASSFQAIAYLQIGLICVLAPVFMAGAIAQESNPKTWDVMLTTPLSQAQIVLGNLFGRLFFILALLFCSLPLFALTQFFGGVPGVAILASYLIAGGAALLVGTIAVTLAVSRLAGRRAVFTFYVAVVSYLAVTAGIDAFLRGSGLGAGPNGNGVTLLTAVNPFLALTALLNPSSYVRGDPEAPGLIAWLLAHPVTAWSIGSIGLSHLLMLFSGLTVRAGGLAGGGRDGVPWYTKLLGRKPAERDADGEATTHRAPRSVWMNPIAWREAAARNATTAKIVARWTFVSLGLLFGLGLVAAFHGGSLTPQTFRLAIMTTVWAEVALITLVAINISATAISREREDGTLDLLLTTPITPKMYLSGKLRGVMSYLLPLVLVPLVTLGLGGLYVLFDGFGRSGGVLTSQNFGNAGVISAPVILPESALILAAALLPFLAFCVMIGLQWSLKSKGTIGSVVGAVAVVGAIGGTLGLCGWRAGMDMAVVGPSLSALTPITVLYSVLSPLGAMEETVVSAGAGAGLTTARVSLAVGAVIAIGIYLAVVAGVQSSMVRNFDFTVRKLAGTK